MAKEYDHHRITPENAEEKIDLFLKDARVGSVEFIAFCDALEWRSSLNDLLQHQHMVEKVGTSATPEVVSSRHKTRSELFSGLRVAEIRHALADFEGRKNGSAIPGYTSASVYSHELIERLEENIIQTSDIDLADPILQELRRRDEAFDYINESLFEIKMSEQNAGAHWLIGLIQNLK